MSAEVVFTVIIPTFNRAASLERLVASFTAACDSDRYPSEIIVVNNGSTDRTGDACAALKRSGTVLSFQLLDEPRKGKASALNRGLAVARGQYILVIDDDVVVAPDILSGHLECYRCSEFAAVQGRILPGRDPAGQPADLTRLREYNIPLIDYGEQIKEIRGLTGTNMSFKRHVFETVGPFDPRLGPGASGFSEDTEFSRRIRNAGFKIGYTPHAVVYHELDPARFGRTYNRMVEYRKGQSRSIYRNDSILTKVFPNLLANCFRYIFYIALGNRQKAYKTEGRILKCWGQLMGTLELRGRRKVTT